MWQYTPRVAIIRGLRTPFAKSGSNYARLSALDLGKIVVAELVERSGIDPKEVQELVFGNVIPSVKAPNIAREIVLGTGLPRSIPGYTVSKACASSNQAISSAADLIFRRYADIVIAGGSESLSDIPILFGKKFADALVSASKKKSLGGKLGVFSKIRPRDLAPDAPALAESTTGLTMGESAEKMAKENGISREAQDKLALQSHLRAAKAIAEGRFKDEVMTVVVPPGYDDIVEADKIVRADTTLDALAKLRPVFDRKFGTITAGNASPLTDGAAAVLMMSEEKAKAMGIKPIGFLKSYAYASTDPADQLLQGPVFALPLALRRAGALEHPVDRLAEDRPGEARAERSPRRDRSGEDQPHRRLNRHRSPFRRHRRTHRHHGMQRAPAHRRAVRSRHRLRRGWDGGGDDSGERVAIALPGICDRRRH